MKKNNKKEQTIKKEFILPIIIFIAICINAVIIVILSLCVKGPLVEKGVIQSLIIGIEAVIVGITMIIIEKRIIKKEHPKCLEKCTGIIMDARFELNEAKDWIKYPKVKYEVDKKIYQIKSSVGINGILSCFIKKMTVYYNKENPRDAYTKNIIPELVANMFIIIGIILLITVIYMI